MNRNERLVCYKGKSNRQSILNTVPSILKNSDFVNQKFSQRAEMPKTKKKKNNSGGAVIPRITALRPGGAALNQGCLRFTLWEPRCKSPTLFTVGQHRRSGGRRVAVVSVSIRLSREWLSGLSLSIGRGRWLDSLHPVIPGSGLVQSPPYNRLAKAKERRAGKLGQAYYRFIKRLAAPAANKHLVMKGHPSAAKMDFDFKKTMKIIKRKAPIDPLFWYYPWLISC